MATTSCASRVCSGAWVMLLSCRCEEILKIAKNSGTTLKLLIGDIPKILVLYLYKYLTLITTTLVALYWQKRVELASHMYGGVVFA